ncbi:MAG: M1 family metallopeptidase [Flavobacteriales bacterium]|nr:M1 family metallopeptidase [Flavobacteriales bacterium]
MKFLQILFSFIMACGSMLLHAQRAEFTRADSLRGSLRPERTCYDVKSYDLHLRVDTTNQSISGSNRISFQAVQDFKKLQIDLFANMSIQRITFKGAELKYQREFDAVFVEFSENVVAGSTENITVYFSGKPLIAKNPPWDGGFTWTQDNHGLPWIGVSCQGIGASLWWPTKEDPADEPEKMNLHINVPNGLRCVANGNEENPTTSADGTTTYHWNISYPINNYNVSINIGDYVHLHDTYRAEDGDTLSLDYYVIRDNRQKAISQFRQVKPMLACYEKFLGKYPFWNDGYALIETPYLGMEHQSGIAYGNRYKTGYAGMDRSGMNLPFDYIIIHETGHEWWGNSVTCRDLADMWIHESFCTYTEAIYVECMYNYDTAMTYVNALRNSVSNTKPIIGVYGVNREGHGDMYVKGMLFLNTLRHVVNNDDIWWPMIKNMSDTTFKMTAVNYDDVVTFFNQKSGLDLTRVFEQYVKHPSVPELEYCIKKKKGKMIVSYRWKAQVEGFDMPIDVNIGDEHFRLKPGTSWKSLSVDHPIDDRLLIDDRKFYIRKKQVTKKNG